MLSICRKALSVVVTFFFLLSTLYALADSEVGVAAKKLEPSSKKPKKNKINYRGEKNVELTKKQLEVEKSATEEANKIDSVISSRGMLYNDPEVEKYLSDIARKIAAHKDAATNTVLTVRVIRDPLVNAFAMSNGSIYVHTGALARLENEAQLSFLLAHEISHVARKDLAVAGKSQQDAIVAFKLLNIVLAPTAVFFGIFGSLAELGVQLIFASTITGYSREVEARADIDGVTWIKEQGYHPAAGADLQQIFLDEREKYRSSEEIYFLMNHPSTKWRHEKLEEALSEMGGSSATGEVNEKEFLEKMSRVKIYNAELNIKMDRLEHALDNVNWVVEKFPDNLEARYIAGEIYRLKASQRDKLKEEMNPKKWKEMGMDKDPETAEKAWRGKALEEYNYIMSERPDFADAYKGMGSYYQDTGDKPRAIEAFNKYLALAPDAKDKRYVQFQIKQLSEVEPEVVPEKTKKSKRKGRS